MRIVVSALSLTLVGLGSWPAAGAEPTGVKLAPHRAVYELSLATSQGARTIESAKGRIAFEFTGNVCEGYALSFRQVTVLESSENGTKTSDLRTTNFESGDGRSFRFRNETIQDGSQPKIVDGSAEKGPDAPLAVTLKAPARAAYKLDGTAVFPNIQMRDVIAAAEAGETTLSEKIYDGSDDARKIYDTLAVIGKRIEPGATDGLEAPAKQDGLAKLPRWPVTVSYFTGGRADGTPVYVLGFEVYENGISRALKLDYGDFALKGELSRLDLLPEKACQR